MNIKILTAALLGLVLASTVEAKDMAAKEPMKVAEEMLDAWHRLNLDDIANMFTEDGVLHSVMKPPVQGRTNIKTYLTPLITGATRLDFKLKNVVVKGNVVILERVDDFDFKGKSGQVPVVGVMEIENGKVKEWREYYDYATLAATLAP